MITAGIDVGSKTTEVVILKDGSILGKGMAVTGFELMEAVEAALDNAVKEAKVSRNDIEHIVATGSGRESVTIAKDSTTDIIAAAKGAIHLVPSARTVIDIGADEGRGLRCDAEGKVLEFAVNERCAAGAGAFVEAMARALEMKLEDMATLSLQAEKAAPINAQCVILAESEVVSQVHAKIPRAEIALAVHDAMADRIVSMVRRAGIEKDVVLIGGVAKNPGFVASLNKLLGLEVTIPEDPELVGALGAAIAAQG
jgi:benzoyl-CoA reductase subunit D